MEGASGDQTAQDEEAWPSASGGGAELRGPPGPKRFPCQHCGNSYEKAIWLQRHVRVHTEDRPYVCGKDGCTFAAAAYSALANHIRNKHGETFPCPVEGCGFVSKQRHRLMIHSHKHVGGGGEGGGEVDYAAASAEATAQLAAEAEAAAEAAAAGHPGET
jgi:uncharacterized Zn-finger protein